MRIDFNVALFMSFEKVNTFYYWKLQTLKVFGALVMSTFIKCFKLVFNYSTEHALQNSSYSTVRYLCYLQDSSSKGQCFSYSNILWTTGEKVVTFSAVAFFFNICFVQKVGSFIIIMVGCIFRASHSFFINREQQIRQTQL